MPTVMTCVLRAPPPPTLLLLLLLLLLLGCAPVATAISPSSARLPAETLIADARIPVFQNGQWVIMSPEEHHYYVRRSVARRAREDATATTTVEFAVSTATAEPTSTTAVAASPLPSPLDTLGANFTGGSGACPSFINSFLANPTFKQCYPFSMLLQGSSSFFEAEKSLVTITQVLDASCHHDVDYCSSWLDNLATNLTSNANCGADYANGNSVVVRAYQGLKAYRPLYGASCLKDPTTSAYCFANAVTNLTTPSNVYLYFLPLNLTMPSIAQPSCNWCNQQTMGIFQAATARRSQSIASTYANASAHINAVCGAGFVNATLPAAVENAAPMAMQSPLLLLLLPLVLLASLFNMW